MQIFEQLEFEFGSWVGNSNAVAVSSGSSALHIACEVAKHLHGVEMVIIPDYTMIACPRAASLSQLGIHFCDINSDLLIEIGDEPPGVNISTVDKFAVMPVHVYGRQVDVDGIFQQGFEIVIEDLAEGHGIKPHSNSFAACYSFYKNKIVAGEEGGMILFRDPEAAKLAKQLRSLGFTDEHDYRHIPFGINARMSNSHAELILRSLRQVDENLARREESKNLCNQYMPMCWQNRDNRKVNWVYDLRIPGLTYPVQDLIIKQCRSEGIEARHGFKPCSLQPEYEHFEGTNPEAYKASNEVIYLPMFLQFSPRGMINRFLAICRSFGIVPN